MRIRVMMSLLMLAIGAVAATAAPIEWSRFPVFPPGYAEVAATEILADGTVLALDVSGRIIDGATGTMQRYPYGRSSVRSVLRTHSGILILYYDGTLGRMATLAGTWEPVATGALHLAPDGAGGAYVASTDGTIQSYSGSDLVVVTTVARLHSIAARRTNRLYSIDSSGVLMEWLRSSPSSSWTSMSGLQIPEFDASFLAAAVLTDDTLLLANRSGDVRPFTPADGVLHPSYDLRTASGFRPLTPAGGRVAAMVVDSSGIAFCEQGNSGCLQGAISCASYSYTSEHWQGYATTPALGGLMRSAHLRGSTLVVGTSNGSIGILDIDTVTPVIRRRRNGVRAGWLSSCRDGRTIAFVVNAPHCTDTPGRDGYLVACWNTVTDTWSNIHEVAMRAGWLDESAGAVTTALDYERGHLAITLGNRVALVDLATGIVTGEVRLGINGLTRVAFDDEGSLIAVNFVGHRFVLDDTLGVLRTDTCLTQGTISPRATINRTGDVVFTLPSNAVAIYDAERAATIPLVTNTAVRSLDAAFSSDGEALLLAGETQDDHDFTFEYAAPDWSPRRTGSAPLSTPATPFVSGWLSDGPDVVWPVLNRPAMKIFRASTQQAVMIASPSGWNGRIGGRESWNSVGLQHQLDDSTYLIVFDVAEMWRYGPTDPVSVDEPPPMAWIFNLAPNPTSGTIRMDVGLLDDYRHDDLQVDVVTLAGERFLTRQYPRSAIGRRGFIDLDLGISPSGMYLVSVSSGGYRHSRLLSVVR